MSERIPVMVLGLGNVLCSDDGAGVVALHRIVRDHALPEVVVAIDGGTLGLALLPLLEQADHVVIVDAIRGDGPPGTLLRVEGDDVASAVVERLSPHQIGVADLLGGASLLGTYPETVVIVGVVPDSIELGRGLTPPVEAAIPGLVARVLEELAALGVPAVPLTAGPAPAWSRNDAARALGL